MIIPREDLEVKVLEDKLNQITSKIKKIDKKIIYHNNLETNNINISENDQDDQEKGNKRQKRPDKLSKSNCDHYAIDSNNILNPKDIYDTINRNIEKQDFCINKIVKTHSRYIRLSINISVNNEIKERVLKALKALYGVKIRKLKMRYNEELKEKVKKIVKPITILTLNINNLKNKVEELSEHLNKFAPSIVCLQETRRKDITKGIRLFGYQVEEVPVSETGLGLLIAVRKDSGLIPKVIKKAENYIIISVKNEATKLLVVNIYRHNKGAARKETMQDIVQCLNEYENKELINGVILAGDWNSTPEEILRICERAHVKAFTNDVPTRGTRIKKNRRRTKKVVDFAISNKKGLINKQTCKRGWNLSDHIPILIKLNIDQKPSAVITKNFFDRKLLENKKVIKSVLKMEQNTFSNKKSAEELVKEFNNFWKQKLQELKVIRKITIKHNQLLLPKNIKRLIIEKNETDKLVRKKIIEASAFIEKRKAVKLAIKKLRRARYLNFIKRGIKFLQNNDYRNSWRWVKRHSGTERKNSGTSDLIDPVTKDLTNDPNRKMEIWSQHFYNLCKKNYNELVPNYENQDDYSEITDCPILWDEIIFESKCTRNNKAAGVDNIPSEFYKIIQNDPKCESNFSKNILHIFNTILNEGICPKDWEDCIVVPIFKKGDPSDPSNYRGIALINTLQKLFAKIIARRLQNLNENFPILRREQVGFIKSEECAGQAACLLESLQRRKFRGKDTLVCFLDLKKAYDMVPHKRLIAKLKSKKLGPKIVKVIESFYLNTRMRVKVGEDISEQFRYERGVRQGCPTSPLLFNIYIDDLLDDIRPVEVEGLNEGLKGLLFADDTVILAESEKDLESKLITIEKWMDENSMEINPIKCGIMQIKALNEVSSIEIKYKREKIPNVNKYVYLGIEFNDQLDLKVMSEFRVHRGVSKAATLSNTLKNKKVPLEFKKMLIGGIIIPVVSYGSELFGMSEKRCSSLKKIVDRSLGMVLGSKNFSRNRVYEEFDLKPIQVKAAASRARGFSKWSQSNGLIKDLIATSEAFKSRKHTWSKTTRLWLKRFSLENIESRSAGRKEVLEEYIPRIRKRDKTLASRIAIKYKFGSGKLIRRIEINDYSSSGLYHLTRLRTGTYRFSNNMVFCGQLSKEYFNKCIFCNKKGIEDIQHLIIECSAWKEDRRKYLGIGDIDLSHPQARTEIKSILTNVLGGNHPASVKKPAEWISASGRFLSAISRKRAAVVAALLRGSL